MARRYGSKVLAATIGLAALALAACGGGGEAGIITADGGSVRADGGAVRADGGSSAGGDGGACTTTSQCGLAQVCRNRTCQADTGGIGAECPTGNECAQDSATFCTGSLPNGSSVCTRECNGASDCPGAYTCQTVPVSDADGGVQQIQVCLPADALGKVCRNEDSRGNTDPVQDCTQQGYICLPDAENSPTGNCVQGDSCSFTAQTGCTGAQTCHPAGAFGFDNNQGTICQTAAATGGGQLASCQNLSDCGKGFVCVPVSQTAAVCLKYCTPGSSTHSCAGLFTPTADGGMGAAAECIDILADADGGAAPASIGSIPIGVCF